MSGIIAIGRLIQRLRHDRRGLGVVEFALAAPFLILLYVGSYQLMDAISCYRKVAIADHALADLTTRQKVLTPDQADTILKAAKRVMFPYSAATATLVITEIYIDAEGSPQVKWYRASDGTIVKDSDLDVPSSIATPNSHLILTEIVYHYKPVIGAKLLGPLTFKDHIYMSPRISDDICLNTGTAANPQCVGEGASS